MHDPQLLHSIFNSIIDHAVITMNGDGTVTSWNPGAEKIFLYSEDEMLGKDGRIIFTPEDRERGMPEQEMSTALTTGRAFDNRWHMRADGSRFWGEGTVTPLHDEHGNSLGVIKVVSDLTERKHAENKMFRLAHYDMLTGLPNRMYFYNRVSEAVAAAVRHCHVLNLLLIDLDNFKQVNDILGHQAGDELLRQFAHRMRAVLRESDFVARLGGDEFVVLQTDAGSPQAAEALANKLIFSVALPFRLDGREATISVSIGIAVCPQDSDDTHELLKKADVALYRAKNERRSGFHYFTEQMDRDAHVRSRNLAELKAAIKKHSFRLEYQPEVESKTGRIVSVEALLRCDNSTLREYPIDEIVALASENGLMPEIGAWVLNEACSQNERWREAGLPRINMSVNLCPRELTDPDFPKVIDKILSRASLHPCGLEVEVTERDLLESPGPGVKILNDLRSRGVSIVLDDFGVGYSSLSYLRRLPVDRLKLDREFLREIPSNGESCAIAQAVIHLAHRLDINVIAEGVESAEQAEFCRREGCDAMQGIFISPPISAEQMTTLLARDQRLGT